MVVTLLLFVVLDARKEFMEGAEAVAEGWTAVAVTCNGGGGEGRCREGHGEGKRTPGQVRN